VIMGVSSSFKPVSLANVDRSRRIDGSGKVFR
jgi:hypothetical protein